MGGLKPFMISQMPMKISFKIIGSANIKLMPIPISKPNMDSKFNVKINTVAIPPQTDIKRGKSFD